MTNDNYKYLLVGGGLLAVAALLAAAAKTASSTTNNQNQTIMPHDNYYNKTDEKGRVKRGYRNNNPLNIRISGEPWKGKITPNTDGTFEQFQTMAYGFRAAFALLRTYYNKYGCDTIRKIINRWAPATENNTSSYIAHVASWSGIDADKVISPYDANAMMPIVYAMARSENGFFPLMQDVKQGWNLL